MLDFAKAVDYLLENGYLAVINDQVTITGKFKREFKPVPRSKIEQIFPDEPLVVSREAIWKKFITDAQIPHKATSTNGQLYTIRQYSPRIADLLVAIIKVVDYKILVESTKQYYRTNSFKKILSNYIEQRIWKEEYERYEQAIKDNNVSQILSAGSGGNRFED